MGVILARFDEAYGARDLEAQVATEFGLPETVRASRKRRQLGAPFRPDVVRQELLRAVAGIAEVRPDVDPSPEPLAFDRCYGPVELTTLSATDMSKIDAGPGQVIAGDCVGMIGDILIVQGRGSQRGEHFMCSMGQLVGRGIELSTRVADNRVAGQMALQF